MVNAPLPVEILFGVYIGILTGVFPALISFALGFVFRYITGVTIPAFGVVVLGAALAGVNGGLLALADPAFTRSIVLTTAVMVVFMMCLYTHAQGDKLGTTVPRRFSLKKLRERPISKDVVDLVSGQVKVRVVGEVQDMEGYPALPDQLRSDIRNVDWKFPADLPVAELESRFADRLRSEFDLQDVSVRIDEKARATVIAAPAAAGVSQHVGTNRRAVSIAALVPTGLARGDRVTVHTDDTRIEGTVVSASSGKKTEGAVEPKPAEGGETTEGGTAETPKPSRAPTTTGGEGRVTVAVTPPDAKTLLRAEEGQVVVTSRGTRREFELLSLLRRTGQRMQRLTVSTGTPLDSATLGEANVRDTYGVAVLAVRHEGTWIMAPRGDTAVSAGDDLFAVGSREAIAAFQEVVA